MTQSLKVLSLLLTYPSRELCAGVHELRDALEAEQLLPREVREGLEPLFASLATEDLYDLQEQYVDLFDRTKTLSLHLFEHVHGEGRDRGQAMVNLKEMYEEEGLDFDASELPDFVPAFLEFLSMLDWQVARKNLAEPLHIFEALRKRLEEKQSPYAAVFVALAALAGTKAEPKDVAELLKQPTEDLSDLEALDEAWEDAAVEFGAGSALADTCPASREMLNRMAVATQDKGAV